MKQDSLSLEAVLDIYGADAQKWPTEQREGFLALIDRDPEAQALYRQAQALDDCLIEAKQPLALHDVSSLAEAIMVRAETVPQVALPSEVSAGSSDSVQSENPLMNRVLKLVSRGKVLLTGLLLGSRQRQAGMALLAFCLMLGVFIGVNESLGSFVQQGFQLAFFDGTFDGSVSAGSSLEDVLMGSEVL